MYKRTAGLILTGVLATGAVGAVAMTPASATTSDNAVTSRLAGIKSALSGLVSDRTLTQAQADKVASTLDSQLPLGSGRGGMGGRPGGIGMTQSHDAAATALGLTGEELYTAMQGGNSLADVAKDHKVSVDSLVKAMVADAEGDLAAAVKAGAMTQAQADTSKSSLAERITDQVNAVRPGSGMDRGSRGAGVVPSTGSTSGSTSSTLSSAI